MTIAGYATAEGTQRYWTRMTRIAPGHGREALGLALSSIGIGTYLGGADAGTDAAVAQAVERAVLSGINVIDSAINYRYQRAERSIAVALRNLVDRGLGRDEVLVCSKAGFLPAPEGLVWFGRSFASKVPATDLVANSHCLHPIYLADQLERSLANTGLDCLDVYYLHNPETQLGPVDRATLDGRLLEAFALMEQAAHSGRIRWYGIATWTGLRVDEGHGKHLSLERCTELARQAAGGRDSRFRFVQMPVNLGMIEAAARPTQRVGGQLMTALAAARALGLVPVASGSIGQGRLPIQSAALRQSLGAELGSDAQRALQFTRSAPGLLCALVGLKSQDHVAEAAALTRHPQLTDGAFAAILSGRPA